MTTNGGRVNIREISLEALLLILEQGAFSHLVISNALKKYQYLEKKDRAFFTRLTEGTLERLITLDYVLSCYSNVPVKKMKPVIRIILRMGVYQLLYMDSVPDSAACNEAVRLAERKGFSTLKGFVNGVLRSVAREKNNVLLPEKISLSVRYSMPEWIVEKWKKAYGEKQTEKILAAFLEERKTTIRFNFDRAPKEKIKEMLQKEQVIVEESGVLPYAFLLSGYDYLDNVTAFTEGYISVQDIASMMVAEVSGVTKGNQILDVCAAPGGKSLHLAELLHGTGYVEARDISAYKVGLIEENIARTKLSNIKTKVWDATKLDSIWQGKADIVLADLPCSGLGVMGRKNDIKYKITEENCKELAALQRKILEVVSRYVKPGGHLIYSTCTLNPEENQEQVEWIQQNLPFEAENILPFLPDNFKNSLLEEAEKTAKKGYLTFLPGIYQTDGFFLARLKRKTDGKGY